MVKDVFRMSQEFIKSDEYVVHLSNVEPDECHPEDDLNKVNGYESEEQHNMEYKEFLKKDELGELSDNESDGGDPNYGDVEVENDKE
ncbi:hypothetical protein MKX01_023318, partial [Papaver californicum]